MAPSLAVEASTTLHVCSKVSLKKGNDLVMISLVDATRLDTVHVAAQFSSADTHLREVLQLEG